MLSSLFKKIFGSRNDRLVKQYFQRVASVNALEAEMQALSDEQLRAKTDEFKRRHQDGESLDKLLPEAFAVVREGSRRVLNMRHFDVQLIGGMVLHAGKISEMRTGEGKTLVATLPAYLNALAGKGVHVITVNDYLAKRDAEWMSKLYNFLGLSVGINLSQMPHDAKQKAYAADITYGTNNEFGFDYLRDNMVYTAEERVQRGLNYALIDEVDLVLSRHRNVHFRMTRCSSCYCDQPDEVDLLSFSLPNLFNGVQHFDELCRRPLPLPWILLHCGDHKIGEPS